MNDELKPIEELREEATGLGISFHPNTGAPRLAQLIEEFYDAQASGDIIKAKPDDEEDDSDTEPKEEVPTAVPTRKLSKEEEHRKMIHNAKMAAMATKIVTISSNDKRDSEYTTTAYFSMENQHFGIAKLVPLDVPVELEVCLIDVAKTTMITLHKDEIIDGRRTGNKVPVSVRKYNISYEDIEK